MLGGDARLRLTGGAVDTGFLALGAGAQAYIEFISERQLLQQEQTSRSHTPVICQDCRAPLTEATCDHGQTKLTCPICGPDDAVQ